MFECDEGGARAHTGVKSEGLMVEQQTDDNVFAVGDTLRAEEVAVYRWLALHGRLDPASMAEETGVDATAVSGAVERLVRIGLVHRGEEGDDRLWAVDPHLVAAVTTAPVERAIAEQQTRLRLFQDQFAQLAVDYDEARRSASKDLETIPGLTHVRAALNRAAEQCREDMVTVQPGGTRPPEVLQDALRRDSQMLARGVRMRTVYHHTARFNSPSQAYVATASALGGEYRTAHQLVGRMIIFDRELAFMTRRNDRLGAVVVREPSVVHFLYELFEQLWSQAQPFSDAATDGLEAVAKDLDRTILRLLSSGLKDETIARRLGMSLRTTRKHIADMMQALGAESRFQAGVAVSARGLLNDDEEPDGAPTTALA
ncbi:helix-turn-helix transcriptional regulator [[Kitasatospora] papulosa]|uniref:helix-turn-helix transcriptional regulator n=2 Tax=[Kitasatospora] papulosa TaxID=1464011 RepID=UPI00369E4FEB